MTTGDLNRIWVEANQRVVEEAFGRFMATGDWPKITELRRHFARFHQNLDIALVAREQPASPGTPTPFLPERLVLRIRHLLYVPSASPLLWVCVAATRRAVETYRSDESEPKVSSADPAVSTQAGTDGNLLLRAGSVLRDEPAGPFAGGSHGVDGWEYLVNENTVLDYEKVTTPGAFVSQQDQVLERSFVAPPAGVLTSHRAGVGKEETPLPDRKRVFVVHGRNSAARDAMFAFLRSIGLQPIEWSQAVQLTGKGAPYIGEILDAAFSSAQAIIVLMTPDEIAYLRGEYGSGDDDPDVHPAAQARPNVLFEAGMALGRNPQRTILVELGKIRPFSDVAGRHALRLEGTASARKELADRLRTAGCDIDLSGTDWLSAGDLTAPPPAGGGLPLGKRLPTHTSNSVRIDAHYHDRGSGNGRLQLTNYSAFAIYDLSFSIPPEAGGGFRVHAELPVKKLPSGKSVAFVAIRTMGGGADHFELPITARTEDGEPIETEAFISLVG